jgi:probable HAF family extracellular repeat protein
MTPRAINDAGFVVGRFTATDGAKRAFTRTAGSPAVGIALGDESDALAVNNSGVAVGWVSTDGTRKAYLFPPTGTPQDLGTLGGASWAVAISDTGFVIGASENADGELRAIAWTEESGLLDLGALTGGESEALFVVDEGLAAGTSTSLLGTTETLLWSIAEPPLLTALDLIGATVASPVGLNGSGLIAGNLETTTGTRAFVWEEHRGTEDLGTLGGTTARATAVADNGRVVGEAATSTGDLHAFVSAIPETACIVCDEDTTPPAIVCPVVRRAVECTGFPGTSVTLGNPSVSDACGRPVDVTDDAPAVYPTGPTVVTYTATDSEDNVATCTTTVLVADTTPPVINCAPTLSVDAPEGVCGAAVTLTATATDACDGNAVTLIGPNGSLENAVVFGPGETRVSITAIDAAGNRSTCETLVTVTGLDPFQILCDEDLTVQAPADFCGYPEAITATIRDVCAADLAVESASDSYPLGLTNVVFEGSNARGDTDTCTTRLTVVDVTPPTIDCGIPEALRSFPTAFTPVATDACSATYVIAGVRCVVIDGATETAITEGCDAVVQDGVSVVVREVPDYDAGGKVIPADRLEVRWSVTATDPSGNATEVDCAAGLDLDDRDRDNDGIPDLIDNCPDTANTDQLDTDDDGMGDVCDDDPLTGLTAEGSGGCAGGGQAGLLGLLLGLLALAATRRLYRVRSSL